MENFPSLEKWLKNHSDLITASVLVVLNKMAFELL
jgi:hypothetical protein